MLQDKLPPTDSRLRPDQRCLENGEYEMANAEKLRLEQRQRQVTRWSLFHFKHCYLSNLEIYGSLISYGFWNFRAIQVNYNHILNPVSCIQYFSKTYSACLQAMLYTILKSLLLSPEGCRIARSDISSKTHIYFMKYRLGISSVLLISNPVFYWTRYPILILSSDS